MKFQAFLSERAMVSLDKPMLLGVMWITEEHGDPQTVTKARRVQQESRYLGELPPIGYHDLKE
jgi:hypothetical protein